MVMTHTHAKVKIKDSKVTVKSNGQSNKQRRLHYLLW